MSIDKWAADLIDVGQVDLIMSLKVYLTLDPV